MTYVPITFVADEVLTSTKMNLLAANQAAFNDGTGLADGIIVTRHVGDAAVRLKSIDLATLKTDRTSSLVLQSGWSAVAISAIKWGNLCLVEGYLSKSSNIVNGDPAILLPDDMIPITEMQGATYSIAHGAATDKVARSNITMSAIPGKAAIEFRHPSSSMNSAVFSLIWVSLP